MIIIINIVITITDGADAGVMQDINIHFFRLTPCFAGRERGLNCVEVKIKLY